VDDLSNWYIRRSRRRFWRGGDAAALSTLWYSLVHALRAIAPVMPFLADHLWQNLVAGPCDDAPDSVFLAGWPEAGDVDEKLLAEVDEMRRIVELGHQARGEAGIKLRQPLRRLYVRGADGSRAHADEIGDELNVKEVLFDEGPVVQPQIRPNLPVLGPRLGRKLPEVKAALDAGDFEELVDGGIRAAGEELGPNDVLRGEQLAVEGYALAGDGAISVALSTELDEELIREGRARELIRRINELRKELGLNVTDRIRLTLPESERDLAAYAERVQEETLAVELRFEGDTPEITEA
jgi:isoleucyl-tRNA synthetase